MRSLEDTRFGMAFTKALNSLRSKVQGLCGPGLSFSYAQTFGMEYHLALNSLIASPRYHLEVLHELQNSLDHIRQM